MITSASGFQTRAWSPNSRRKTPIVPGPQTSCVIRTSTLTQRLSPGLALALPDFRAKIVSVMVIFMVSSPSGGLYQSRPRAKEKTAGPSRAVGLHSPGPL